MTTGTLYLLPNLLGPLADHHNLLPKSVDAAVAELDGLIAESEREGRRYLSRFSTKKPAREIPIAVMRKTVRADDAAFFLEPVKAGETWGIVSDAGVPCVADPGFQIVALARRQRLPVKALVGPSSLTLALMLSGLPGQRFAFHGYLPRQAEALKKAVKRLEKRAERDDATQLFIEAPYRNVATLQACLEALEPRTRLCVACQITLPEEWVITQPVQYWPQDIDEGALKKAPAVFLMARAL